jgi:tetratricopeptide (TPR) repeat protein
MRDDLDAATLQAVASLRSALAKGAGVGDALREGFEQNAVFFTVFFAGVLLHGFGDRPDEEAITAFITRMCAGRSQEQLGFEPREAEAVIRGAFNDFELARKIGPTANAIPVAKAIVVAIIENILAASPLTPAELDELLATTMRSEREARAITPASWSGQSAKAGQEPPDEAADQFDQAIRSNLADPLAWSHRGSARRERGDYGGALGDYEVAIGLDPSNPFTLIWRAETLRCLERYDAALADATRAIGLEPSGAVFFDMRSVVYNDMERYEEAIADLDRAISLEPAETWRLAGRALAYHNLGNYEKSLADYDQAIELNPIEAWMLVGRGELLQDMGRRDEAHADFIKAIELEPSYAPELEQYLGNET